MKHKPILYLLSLLLIFSGISDVLAAAPATAKIVFASSLTLRRQIPML